MRARILKAKLSFLFRISNPQKDCLSSSIFRVLQEQAYSITLVEQCQYLEEPYGCNFTESILQADGCKETLIDCKSKLMEKDVEYVKSLASAHESLHFVLNYKTSWSKIWDIALDKGPTATNQALCTFKCLSRSLFGDRMCNLCNVSIPDDITYVEHVMTTHLDSDLNKCGSDINWIFDSGARLLTHINSPISVELS